jgi:hypothetical protein
LRARSISVRDKRARMQPAGELVKLGKALMRKAETASTKPSLTRAVWYRDGLMIAFLAHRPLRLSNLAAITLARHLIRQSRGYRLYFSADEVKGGRSTLRYRPSWSKTSIGTSIITDRYYSLAVVAKARRRAMPSGFRRLPPPWIPFRSRTGSRSTRGPHSESICGRTSSGIVPRPRSP